MNRENLWAPWRMAYLRELDRRQQGLVRVESAETNFILSYWRNPDADQRNHVVYRNEHGLILLNRYPYANGHLLVALGAPRLTLLDYDVVQRRQFWELVDRAADLVQRAVHPQGLNIGINQGTAAGAGLPEHIHAHVVPRWHGDTNFMSVVSNVRVIPDALDAMAARYREVLATTTG